MKKGLTEVVFVLDRSGSMADLVDDTIGGFNAFVEEQKEIEGDINLSLFLFNQELETVFVERPLSKVDALTNKEYRVFGTTALLDATGDVINKMGNVFKNRKDDQRPEHVIFCLTTDGQENSSKEFTKEKLKEMVTHQEEKYNWKFNFFGANIDSFAEGAGIGFNLNNTADFNYTSKGNRAVYTAFSRLVGDVRTTGDTKATTEEYYNQANKGE